MLKAARENGMFSADGKSWHISATYTIYNDAGAAADHGTFEEWWYAPKSYKVTITGEKYSQTLYLHGDDLRITGSQEPHTLEMLWVQRYITKPLPEDDTMAQSEYSKFQIVAGQLPMECFRGYEYTSCFAQDHPVLRLFYLNDETVIFNNILKVGSQYIAKEISLLQGEQRILDMKIDTVDFPAQTEETDVLPPPDAVAPEIITIGTGMAPIKKVHNVAPKYPQSAKQAHIEGTVWLTATIEKDGTVDDVVAISGPAELRSSSIEAVKHWRYKPYLLNGKPVMVRTQFTMNFMMAN